VLDSVQAFQTVDGFGYTLTGGSATLINKLLTATKSALLQELFGSSSNSIGISYLRVSIGASDLSATVFSYNDMPAGQTDVNLSNFSLSLDTVDLIPLLKEILAINPNIKILGSPWSAPVWMKDNGNSMGGSLLIQYYAAYSNYFVKYIQAMKANGITIDAVTLQNEPQHGGNNPSMVMSATQQANFVKNNLGPAFANASAFYKNYTGKYAPYFTQFTTKNNEAGRLYLKGIMEMDPVKAKMMYPDATSTMRVSYGAVKSYRPRDAVFYDYVTTSKGLLEKYKAGDYEFDLPAKQIELLKKKDFGQYADPVRKELVIGFITTNDITGGNSGSPVFNGKWALIVLAFHGNYEALSHKLAFDKDLNRTICVDIRYVLWCIDKLGGASHLIRELKIVK